MLRRSWLILLTAEPSAASRVWCASARCAAPLHAAELGLDQADLVAALGQRQIDAGVLRPAAKRDHAVGDPAQRPHDHQLQGGEHEERRDQRDDDDRGQDAPQE